MDTDIRQAVQEHEHQKEKHKKDVEKYFRNFEVKMNEELDKQAKQITEDHRKQMELLQTQVSPTNF